MKPTKNKIFCKDCGRTKMLFETEQKADNFIKFNQVEIKAESGFAPQRSYFCLFCGGWHTTSIKEEFVGSSKNEQIFEQYRIEKQKKTFIKSITKVDNKEKRKQIMQELQSQINEMEDSEKEKFVSENIITLNKEIESLRNSESKIDQEKFKDLCQKLEIFYVIRKQNGIHKSNVISEKKIDKIREEQREKVIEEWRLWAEKRYQ